MHQRDIHAGRIDADADRSARAEDTTCPRMRPLSTRVKFGSLEGRGPDR